MLALPRTFGPLAGPIPTSYLDDNFSLLAKLVVTNIAELRTLANNAGAGAFVLSYSTIGDGGGGWYAYDASDTSSADNGGTIIVSSAGGRWKLVYSTWVSVKVFGAKGIGTDDSVAILAAIAFLTSVGGGGLFFPHGRYGTTQNINVSNAVTNTKGGIYLRGEGPAGQGAVNAAAISEIFAIGAGCTVTVHYGDVTETSADNNHISPGGAVDCLAITGSTFTTDCLRIYNCTTHVRDCYFSNAATAGGRGFYAKKAWNSRFERLAGQSNGTAGGGTDFWFDPGCNNVDIDVVCLTNTSGDGLRIVGGSNTLRVKIDAEGKNRGAFLDSSSATIDNLSMTGNFESNVTMGIASSGGQAINGLSLSNIRCSGAGNGVDLNFLNGYRIDGLFLFNCNLNFNQVGQTGAIGGRSLNGTAAITGQPTSIRYAQQSEPWYEDNAGTGAVSVTYDASVYNVIYVNLTAAATSLTINLNNTALRGVGEIITIFVGNSNTATVGAAVTLPAAFKKPAAGTIIPGASTFSSWTFRKDPNNVWRECARDLNVS